LDALWMLSRLRDAQGRQGAAETLVRRVVALNQNNAPATHDLALRLLQRGALAEAELHARNAVRVAPTDKQSHNLLGMIMTEAHQPATGEFHYRRVLELTDGRDPILLANLAWCLKLQGRMAEARALYEESFAAAPAVFQTLLGWARMEEVDRNFSRALELVALAEQVAPHQQSTALLRAVIHGRMGDYETALAILDAMASQRGDVGLGPEELSEKGRLLDRMGRYEDAFAAFAEGKRKLREMSGHAYLAGAAEQTVGALKRFFTEERLKTLPRALVRTDVPQPIFILGFPRSGTTLVEQTLTAHPLIAAGDELPFITEISNVMPRMLESPMPYPEALAELWMGDRREGLDNLRDHYLQRVRQRGVLAEGAAWFTDKMPLNEMHLGLIALMFPATPLIHVLRHPLDVVLSTFSNHLTHGFYCSYALESAAHHYILIQDLIEHHRATMPLRYLAVRYEDIVTDQEAQVRRMLDFIGVPFDAKCLSFHENRRFARTASYAQVTEKLYDRSKERWRHYREQLAPVIPMLLPSIERLGYSVD
jgi:Flp pilus assembly protein TadD